MSEFNTFICPKCYKRIILLNKIIHLVQCHGDEIQCSKCNIRLKQAEYNDHLLCHSLDNENNHLNQTISNQPFQY